ncbi:MAG: Scr1 family TA system antitoxin-like transcriptional regulator [Labedaea sp.]
MAHGGIRELCEICPLSQPELCANAHRMPIAGQHPGPPDHNEQTVSMRVERQRRPFADHAPLTLTVMLEKVVLDRPIGGADVSHAQLSISS